MKDEPFKFSKKSNNYIANNLIKVVQYIFTLQYIQELFNEICTDFKQIKRS